MCSACHTQVDHLHPLFVDPLPPSHHPLPLLCAACWVFALYAYATAGDDIRTTLSARYARS